MQWIYPAISAPEAQSWEDGGFKANLGYTVTLSPEDTGKKKVKMFFKICHFCHGAVCSRYDSTSSLLQPPEADRK